MNRKYDVVIIGSGPNGLTAGAYLAKAGLKVLAIDKRFEAGGGLATEMVTVPSFLHNTHAIYMMMVDYAPPYKDLELEKLYNVRHVYPQLQFAMPFADGTCLALYTDVEKSCASIAKFSQKDADTYRDIFHKYNSYVQEFLAPATYFPPAPTLDAAVKMQQTEIGREIFEMSEKPPKQIIDELFTNERVKAMMLYIACAWGLEHDAAGVGYMVPLYINRAVNYRLTVGGTHMLTQGLCKVILGNGGMTLTHNGAERIILRDGVAKAVELEDGTIVEADKAILSTIDTHQTFLKLVGEENLDAGFVESIKLWRWEHWSHLTVSLALEEAPDFSAAAGDPELNEAFVYILGYETPEDVIKHWEAIDNGDVKGLRGFTCSFPSIHDPSQAPMGRHTGLISQQAPYELEGKGPEGWYPYKFRQGQADKLIGVLQRYAPNITEEVIRSKYISTPLDVENKFTDMVRGSIKQGEYFPLQMGYNRPNAECSNHRSPVKGLYMGGACTYPGGTVLLGPGYLGANAIAEDLGIEKWWSEPEIVTNAIEKGML